VGGASGLAAARVIARVRTWLVRNLFSSPVNTLLTVLVAGFLWLTLPPIYEWAVGGATLAGSSKAACTGDGACWTFIKLRLHTFMWGHYPDEELWRLAVATVLLVVFAVPVMRDRVRHRGIFIVLLLTVFPVLAGILLVGDVPGLPYVDTSLWGGLMLDVTIAFVRRFDMETESALLWETRMHVGFKFGTMAIRARREGVGHPYGCNQLWSSTMEQLSGAWRSGNLWAHSVFTAEADGCPLRVETFELFALSRVLCESANAFFTKSSAIALSLRWRRYYASRRGCTYLISGNNGRGVLLTPRCGRTVHRVVSRCKCG